MLRALASRSAAVSSSSAACAAARRKGAAVREMNRNARVPRKANHGKRPNCNFNRKGATLTNWRNMHYNKKRKGKKDKLVPPNLVHTTALGRVF